MFLVLFAACSVSAQTPPYKVVKVCPLVTLAEVKKLAPWAPHLDPIAKAEEEPMAQGSACNYPTVRVQVLAFRQQLLDSARKTGKLEPVSGVGDGAYVQNNKNRYAELIARVGPHMLTVQQDIATDKTFDTTKPSLVGWGKFFRPKRKKHHTQ